MNFKKIADKFLKGGIKAAILAVAALLSANKIDTTGVDFEALTTILTALLAAIAGGLFEALRNYLKMKYKITWL